MDPVLIVPLVVGIVLFALLMLSVIFMARFKCIYLFSVHSHEVKVEIGAGGAFLYVDGALEEQLSGQNVRFATMRATVDGEEFKVHLTARGMRIQVQATHGGRDVPCVGVKK